MAANLISSIADLSPLLSNVLLAVGNPSPLCVLGSHLLVHLKEAAEKGLNEGTSYRSKTLSGIDFGQETELSEPSEYSCLLNTINHLSHQIYIQKAASSRHKLASNYYL